MQINANIYRLFVSLLVLIVLSCDNKDTDFRDFFGGKEITYPGVPTKVSAKSGKNRAAIQFTSSPDPSIVRYVVYWNNKKDSLVFPVGQGDEPGKVKSLFIPNLSEYTYSFTVYSLDSKGNRSIPLEVNNIKVYGEIYENGRLNRAYNVENPYTYDYDKHKVMLNFLPTDTIDGYNVGTIIKYETISGATVEKNLKENENSIELLDYKHGSDILYKSSYVPERNALDTFSAVKFDTYTPVLRLKEIDKKLFSELKLAGDLNIYNNGECPVRKLWDGSVGPQGYPNIFHSADGSKMPQAFTFDLGRTYDNLAVIEETGRNCCGNPLRFEVWGINDLTNAATTLDPSDANWKAESAQKGWTLLRDAIRTDNGNDPMRFDLKQNPPPVRYIRIRIIQVSGGGNTANMSELSFWNREL